MVNNSLNKIISIYFLIIYKLEAPAGTSTKNLVHFAQMVINKNFQMYDYGADNMAHYNQSTAPVYNI